MGKLNYFSSLFILSKLLWSQIQVSGNVKDDLQNPLSSVSIILKDSASSKIISYTSSSKNGKYNLTALQKGHFLVLFKSLGYTPKTIPIVIKTNQKKLNLDVVLEEKEMEINEIVYTAKNPVKIKKDTISFKTKYYTDGTEVTVEDLLSKIPGIQIGDNGKIKIGNQEIEKLMIEGDDFFEKGYKVLSKNMPAYPVEQVEVLKNYSNNRLLKGIKNSNKVALNLKLDEKSKRIWFGNLESDLGIDSFYQFKVNLMNFGEINKYYFLTNFNTIGNDPIGSIQDLIRPFRVNEPGSIGDNQKINPLLNLAPNTLNFKKKRTNFNNAKLVSLNAIFNPNKKLKIKTLGFLNWDKINFYRNTTDRVQLNQTNFTNTENYNLENNKRNFFGKLDLIYNVSKTKMLEATTKYNHANFSDGSKLFFNDTPIFENLKHQNSFFDQKISYTNKFKNNDIVILTGRFIDEITPQEYSINQFYYQDLFPDFPNANNSNQLTNSQMQFAGMNAYLIRKTKKAHLIELQLGNEFQKDKLDTRFSILKDTTLLEHPNNYQNKINFIANDLYIKSKYKFTLNDFGIKGKLDFHQLYNQLENNNSNKKEHPFFINSSLGIDWKINEKNKIASSIYHNKKNTKINDIYSNFALINFRQFSKGTSSLDQLKATSLNFNYQLGNWSDQFFLNTTFQYLKNHDFLSTNSIINQNYIQTERILFKDKKFLTFNTKIDYYIYLISSNFRIDLGYSKSNYKNQVNNSELRNVNTFNYTYGIELRSALKGVFNYHLGTKWNSSKIKTSIDNSFINNLSFLDLTFVFNKKFDLKLNTDYYYFGGLEENNSYYFLDFNINYKLIDKKLSLGLNAKNLFNTKRFKDINVSDIGITTTEYRLLPRTLLLNLEYRF